MKERNDDEADAAAAFERLLEAMSDKHAQFDLNVRGLSVRLPGTPIGLEFTGMVTMTVHMRDLTSDEKEASAAKNIALMSNQESAN